MAGLAKEKSLGWLTNEVFFCRWGFVVWGDVKITKHAGQPRSKWQKLKGNKELDCILSHFIKYNGGGGVQQEI